MFVVLDLKDATGAAKWPTRSYDVGEHMRLVLADMDPAEQLALCEDLFYNETDLLKTTDCPELRAQHFEHVDAILDYRSDLIGMIGSIALVINNYY